MVYRQFKDIRLSISAARRVSSSHLWTASQMFKGNLEGNNFFDIVQVNKFSNFLENFVLRILIGKQCFLVKY
jgi:hypothetical protein